MLGKTEDDLIERVRKAQPRLYPTKVAGDGSIMEWVCEKLQFTFSRICTSDSLKELKIRCLFFLAAHLSLSWQAQDFKDPEVHHRHLSHLFGLFPGHTITTEKTPDLCKAAAYTLLKRG